MSNPEPQKTPTRDQLQEATHKAMARRGYFSRPLENDITDAIMELVQQHVERGNQEMFDRILAQKITTGYIGDNGIRVDIEYIPMPVIQKERLRAGIGDKTL